MPLQSSFEMRARSPIRLLIALLAVTACVSAQELRKPIAKPAPRYPEIAKRMALVGTVKVEVLVGADGKVKNVTVLGGHPILATATVDAVKEWKFEPSKAETVISLSFDFKP